MKTILSTLFCLSLSVLGFTQTTTLLSQGLFTSDMEGPSVDKKGNLYAVNYIENGTVAKVDPLGNISTFVTLPKGSVGNGSRIYKNELYLSDFKGHTVLKVNLKTKKIDTVVYNQNMNQPNDLTIAPNGNIYTSDPNWAKGTGQIWLVKQTGESILLETNMGTTNGIEVSPDGKWLYVNESIERNIWKYEIAKDGTIKDKTLIHNFPDHGLDGMRCDRYGNLYITRYGKGSVVILSSKGEKIYEVETQGKKVSNITFGGKDNWRCYLTFQDRKCFEYFDVPTQYRTGKK